MLYLNTDLPALHQLRTEGVPIASGHHDAALNVWMLNLMPLKCATELDLCRMLAASGIEVNLTLVKFPGQTYKSTPQAYVEAHYLDLDSAMLRHTIDGLIITGAPLENIPFEAVRYWEDLCCLMTWSTTHTRSTLNICWAAQAALYFHHRVPKHPLAAKMFGVFPQTVYRPDHPLMQGLGTAFPMPHSRHTEVQREALPPEIEVLAGGGKSGLGILADAMRRQVFAIGHLEYEPLTLDGEYRRDLAKGLPILPPENYYFDDCPDRGVDFSWRTAALQFYKNWLTTLRPAL